MRSVSAAYPVLGLLLLLTLGAARPTQGVPRTPQPAPSPNLHDLRAADILRQQISKDSIALANAPLEVAAEDPTKASAYQAYYRMLVFNYSYASRVYSWQLLSTQIIFLFVIGLVAAGLWFSWLQFRMDLRTRERMHAARTSVVANATVPAEAPPEAPTVTNLKVGTQGLEVSSSVLGVIILTLSLAFLYLYLVYVYPINEVK